MKTYVCAILFVQAVIVQTGYSQIIRGCGPNILGPLLAGPLVGPTLVASPCLPSPPPCVAAPPTCVAPPPVIRVPGPVIATSVVPSNSVANSLADTLSLLTVSSLLAETLPLSVPVLPYASLPIGGCGCGCGSTYYI